MSHGVETGSGRGAAAGCPLERARNPAARRASSRYNGLISASSESGAGRGATAHPVAGPSSSACDPATGAAVSRFLGSRRGESKHGGSKRGRRALPEANRARSVRFAARASRAARFAARANTIAARHGARAATSAKAAARSASRQFGINGVFSGTARPLSPGACPGDRPAIRPAPPPPALTDHAVDATFASNATCDGCVGAFNSGGPCSSRAAISGGRCACNCVASATYRDRTISVRRYRRTARCGAPDALYSPCVVCAAAIRAIPDGVRGPVLFPPWNLHRPFAIAGARHAQPERARAPQRLPN